MINGHRSSNHRHVPVAKGGTFCTPGPFGAGKTVLQHHLSKYSDVDIVIVAAESALENGGNDKEFPELDDPTTGKSNGSCHYDL